MDFILNIFSSPISIFIHSLLTYVILFLTIRDKYITFPNFKIEDEVFIYFKEGIYLVEFTLINNSKVPLSYREIYLKIGDNIFYPTQPYPNFEFENKYHDILSRYPNYNYKKYQKILKQPTVITYGSFIDINLMFDIGNYDKSYPKPLLILKSGLRKKTIDLAYYQTQQL